MMRCARTFAAAAALTLSLGGCATHQAYLNPQVASTISAHRRVAVLPFLVSISRENMPKALTSEDLVRMEKEEGLALQRQLHAELLRRAGRYTVEFQDVSQTNLLLNRAGISQDSLYGRTREELAELLGVDAVISGSIHRFKPMSGGEAYLMGFLCGGMCMGETNRVGVELQLHDRSDGGLLWNYSQTDVGYLFSSPEKMARQLMSNVARRLPYRRGA
jgi:hypothetical protein